MFLHLSVSHSVHGGGLPQCMLGHHRLGPGIPLEQTPPEQTAPPPGAGTPRAGTPRSRHDPQTRHIPTRSRHPPTRHIPIRSRRLLLRTVRILLECILVSMHERKIAGNAEHKVMKPGFPNFLIFFLRNFDQKKWTGRAFLMTPRSAIDECSQIFPDEAHAQGN